MEPNRSYRRMGPHKEVEFSSQSIMKAMESFVEAVKEMDETILVPSRLMDLEVGDSAEAATLRGSTGGKTKGKTEKRDNLSSTDLYRMYNMINTVRQELLWGGQQADAIPEEEEPECEPRQTSVSVTSSSASGAGHVRRPSLASLASSQSLSDTDSETGNENDSGIEGEAESPAPDYTVKMEDNFRRHLHGLQRSLLQMTSAAAYLTKRYQSDIGAVL